ncbi:PAS domain-containing protein [Planctomycetota bacterium]|nr:PAS domain-containing protein [Planctomycetota bacterium]
MSRYGNRDEADLNITTTMALEDFLANKSKYFEMLIENIDDVFWIFDVKEQKSVYLSPAFTKITGHDRMEIIANFGRLRDMVFHEDLHIFDALYAEVMAGQSCDIYYRILGAEGNLVWFRCRSNPIFNEEGEHTHAVGICRDVTQRIAVENALRDSKNHYQQLAQSNRQLVMEVNHRVRNNLAGLLSLIKLTKSRCGTVDKFAGSMKRRIELMSVVHDALAQQDWRALDFRDLVHTMLFSIDSPPNVKVKLDGPSVMLMPRQVMPLVFTLMEIYNVHGSTLPLKSLRGTITLKWELQVRDGRKWLKLLWRQDLSELPELPMTEARQASNELAEELVTGFIEYELGGECSLTTENNVTTHMIAFPIDSIDAAPQVSQGEGI